MKKKLVGQLGKDFWIGGKNALAVKRLLSFVGVIILIVSFAGISMLVYNKQQSERRELEAMKLEGINVYLDDYEISALVVEGDIAYVGGKDGIYIISIESGEIIETLSTDLSLVYTASMIMSSDHKLWVGHDSGLSVMNNETWIHYQTPDIPKGRCNKILEVKDTIYAGFQEGLVKFHRNSEGEYDIDQILTKEEGLAENNVNAIYMDDVNQLWLGSYLSNQVGGLSILSNNEFSYISTDEGLTHKYVTDIKGFDFEGELYTLVGCGHLTSGGLNLFKLDAQGNNLISTFNIDDGIPGEKVRYIYISDMDDIWITTESDGLMITSKEALVNNQLEGIYLDKISGLSDNEIKIVGENESYYILGGRFGITTIKKDLIKDINTN